MEQTEEYVRLLPKFHTLECVHFQLVFVQKQVSSQLVQVVTTIPYQLTQEARHFYLQAVVQVYCQLPQAEGRVTS